MPPSPVRRLCVAGSRHAGQGDVHLTVGANPFEATLSGSPGTYRVYVLGPNGSPKASALITLK